MVVKPTESCYSPDYYDIQCNDDSPHWIDVHPPVCAYK